MDSLKKKSTLAPDGDNACERSCKSDASFINGDDGDEEESECSDTSGNEDDAGNTIGNYLNGTDCDYMTEAMRLLETRAEVNIDNALELNLKLQNMLSTLRDKIISMLNKCREKYMENHKKLSNPTPMTSLLRGIGSCGAPFFKDACGKPCPPNADYTFRSEVEKELFPSDLALYPHFIWTPRDKVGILQGIKEQAIEHIERKETYSSTSAGKRKSALSKNVQLHSLKLKELLNQVDEEFTIDWNQISVYNLKSRHTASSCYAIWNVYLKPDINRGEWTEKENLKLNALAKKYKFQDWIAIASEMKGRSDYQCFVQYQTVVSIRLREDKGERWTKEEDELLLSLIEKHRMGSVIRWNPICSQFPNRTKKQCFSRYKYSINPNISRAPFTPEEDCIILAAVEEYGENFNYFPKALFPNRTIVQVRCRYYNSIKIRETKHHWTPEDDKILLHLVTKYGSHDWKKIAEEIKRHSRTSCRTRFVVISKFLKDNPNAKINEFPRKNRVPFSSVTKRNWMTKIVEINQKLPKVPVKIVRKQTYRSKLRNNERKWHDFFKYAYDFQFGKSFSRAPTSVKSLEFVRIALDIPLRLPIILDERYMSGVVCIALEKLVRTFQDSRFKLPSSPPVVGYRFPPSYSTLLAFRGLCIARSVPEDKEPSPKAKPQDTHAAQQAKAKFRQRLHALLYKTALLSRLEPDKVVEKSHFQVIFDPNTPKGKLASRSLAELKVAQLNEIAEHLKVATQKAKRKRKPTEPVSKKPKRSEQ